MLTLSHRMLYALLMLFAMPPAAAMNTHRSEPPVAPVISQHVSEEDVHPTLDEIYKPPRLLGQRPTDFGMSADGQWITYRWADEDSEDAPGDLYLLSTRGSTTEVLATEDEDVDVLWTHTDAVLLRERDGWIDRIDIGGDGQPVPLFEGASLGKVQFLEDARRAIIQAGEDNQLWIVDLLTGSRRALASDLKKRSSWYQVLEDRGQIALFAQADAPPPQTEEPSEAKSPSRVLWTVPLGEASSSAQQTDMEKASNTQISPDGRWAVAYTRESTVDRELVMADYLTEQVTVVPVRSSLAGDDASALEMQLFDLESSEKHPLSLDAQDKFRLRRVEWSPDGSTLLIDRISNDFHVRQILVVQADTREIDVVLAERDEAWIGGPTTWANWNDAGTHILFTSERSGFNHLYRVRSDGSELTSLTAGDFEVQQVNLLNDHGRALLVTSSPEDPAVRHLRLVDLDTAEQIVLTGEDGCAADHGWSPRNDTARPHTSLDGSTLVYMWETLGRPGDLYALDLPLEFNETDAPPRSVRLTDFVPEALDKLELVQPEIIEYTNPDDGVVVRSFLYLPEPYDPLERYPLVVFVHGAGYLQNVTRSRTSYDTDKLFHHRLARKGYVVLAPDYRHSAGYGHDFRTDIYGYMGGKDTDDVVAGIKHLEQLGLIDTERVGVYGGSYGGFLTLMCLARYPDQFACGAALRSVTDWRTYHAGYTNPRLGHPDRDAENYDRSSPIHMVDDIQDPVLMLHGLKDDNVFAQDSIRFIEELIQLGKTFDAMLYPSQAHGFTDPESWIDEYSRIEGYMDRYLLEEAALDEARPDAPDF
ncbi:MAG: prolyl oligopeptidase family serine peptidase [Planctomycetota bacterium]|nr:prolyl oligopeptidase family serine peptidase [Planctomycetota bacterium]